ncbi:hypothetical protein RvY_05816 [Ramazzottius varieornatus]|uniref:EGF-like domain-containing protein n=1 Tax=Ramazzottius varieornatus TaxID=947166 RepID=A0A1D1UWD4_RAMVA|nr:hypothetical protein RvY_05816 [Ramazzottius varieornatus]
MEFRLWIGATVFCLAFAGIFCDNSTTVEVFTNNSITFLQNTADVDLAPAISENTTFGRDCNTTLDCNSAMSCHNGLCVCPAKSLKVSGTCVGILGLDCSALGQCEQHVANSICDFSTASAGICVCKPGYAAWNLQLTLPTESNTSSRHLYVIANNTCTAVLNAECEGNEGLCSNVDNAKCAVFGTSTKKRCVCADGLRPKGATQRTAIADSFHSPGSSEEPSTSCEDVIGNHCSASGTDYPDCSLFVKNTYCDNETERCTCKEGFTVNNLTKLCENDTIRSQNNATAGNMSRVAVSPFTDEYQLFLTSRCFMLNYPCAVENSICMHSPFSLYEGVCHCEPGYVQTSYTTCESVDGPADEKPGVDTDDIRTTTENPVTTTKATKPSKTTKATTTAKTAKPVKTTTATATATTDGATIDTTDGPSTEAETTETSTDSGATEKPPVTATTAPAMTNPRNCGVPKSAKSRKSGISRQFGVRYPSHDSEDMKKIVGGQAAQENEICWQAGVISFMPNLQNYEYCGGSILNENFVLTAMHCVVQ